MLRFGSVACQVTAAEPSPDLALVWYLPRT